MTNKEQRLKEIQAELAEIRAELEPLALKMFDLEKRQDALIAEMLAMQPYLKEDDRGTNG